MSSSAGPFPRVLLAALLLTLAAAAGAEPVAPLRFLGNAGMPPLISARDGRAEGVVVDLAQALAQKAGIAATVVATDWADAQRQLAAGEADALLHINPNPERLALFDFSEPLLESSFHVFRHRRRGEITDLRSLQGRSVGVEAAGFPIQYLQRHPGIRVVVVPNWNAGFAQLSDGRLDALFVDRWAGEYELARGPFPDVVIVEPAVVTDQSRIAVRKGDIALLARINHGLRAIAADGTRQAILDRWRGKEVVYFTRESIERWERWGAAAAALLLLAWSAWLYAGRRALRARNRELARMHALQQRLVAERDAMLESDVIAAVRVIERRITWASPSMAQLFGYASPVALVGLPTRELYASEADWLRFGARLRSEAGGGRVVRDEIEMRRRDGSRFWVDISVALLDDAAGERLAIFVDATERRAAQAALQQSEQRLLLASEAGQVGVFDLNLATGDSWCSPGVERIFGGPVGGRGWGTAQLLAHIHRDDRAQVQALLYAGDLSGPFSFRCRINRADGELRWIAVRGERQDSADGPRLRDVGTLIDVTDQTRREQLLRETIAAKESAQRAVSALTARYEQLLMKMPVGIAAFGADGMPLFFNPPLCALTGRADAELRGQPLDAAAWQLLDADGRALDAGTHPARRALAGGRPVEGMVVGCGADGAPQRWLLASAYPLRGDDGRAQSVILALLDVTAQRAADQMRHAKEQAESASRAKTEFLSQVSHELRTPLNAILGFGQLMELSTALPPKERTQLGHIMTAAESLLALVNDVLEIGRIESRRFTVAPRPTELRRLVDECIVAAELDDATGVSIGWAEATAELTANIDEQRVRQIVGNLLSNAVKFNRPGGRVGLRLRERADAAGAPLVEIDVEDTGSGLTAVQQAGLFQPFNRLGADARGIRGTGIGLSLSRLLARAMGGDIHVRSAPGVGSCFTLSIPNPRTAVVVAA